MLSIISFLLKIIITIFTFFLLCSNSAIKRNRKTITNLNYDLLPDQEELVKVEEEKEQKVVETAAAGHDSEDPWNLNLPPLGAKTCQQ